MTVLEGGGSGFGALADQRELDALCREAAELFQAEAQPPTKALLPARATPPAMPRSDADRFCPTLGDHVHLVLPVSQH